VIAHALFRGMTLLALAAGLVVSSCAQAPETLPPDVQLIVDLKEYSITLNTPTLKAGVVKIGIRNLGTMVHDFDLIKTDLPFDKLPIDNAAAKANTDGLVRQMQNISPNRVTTLEVNLAAGGYVIICNVAGHYQLGMRAALKVEP
jgi:uncharacterized cupredoxin-like copper-binding protein